MISMQAAHSIDAAGNRLHEGEAGDLPWWSFTKLVMATAALRLVELGRVELDAPAAGADFTLRQLLRHEAGLPDYGALKDYHDAVARGDPAWPPEKVIARTLRAYPPWPAGTRWAYSNIGYYRVGQIVTAAAGLDLDECLRVHALSRAGLSGARLASLPGDLAGVRMGSAAGYDPRWVLHGLLVGPLADAATFLHSLLSGAVLGKAMLAEMLTGRQLPQFRDEVWERPAYGLGVMGANDGAASPCGHSGSGPGSTIAVYGLAGAAGVRVAACWQSPGALREAEAEALGELAQL